MAPKQSTELAVIDDWTPFVLGLEELPWEDDADLVRRIQDEILAQTTSADILAAGEVVPVDEVIGHPMRFKDASLRRSSFSSGPGAYCFIECESLETGERFTVTCGGTKVITKLWAHKRDALFPFEGIFTSRQTSNGNTVKSIVGLPTRLPTIPADAEVVEG